MHLVENGVSVNHRPGKYGRQILRWLFLNNTSVFTQQLLTSFGFVILISILIDIGAQLNIWRIITVSENRAQDLSNKLLPGLGYLLAA